MKTDERFVSLLHANPIVKALIAAGRESISTVESSSGRLCIGTVVRTDLKTGLRYTRLAYVRTTAPEVEFCIREALRNESKGVKTAFMAGAIEFDAEEECTLPF